MRRYITGLVLACLFVWVEAQKMENVFVQMPDELIVQLEEAWRKDLVGLYKSGKPARLENTMSGQSVLLTLTDQYLKLQLTEHCFIELRLLPLINNTYIICMVKTVFGPVADSSVSFYTSEWQPLPSEGIFVPVAATWFRREDLDEKALDELIGLDMFLVRYSLSEEHATLTAEYTTPQYLDDDNRQIVEKFLKTEPKMYEWKSGRFE